MSEVHEYKPTGLLSMEHPPAPQKTWTDKDGRKWAVLGDTILVERSKAKEETHSGIKLAEKFVAEPVEGTVLCTGNPGWGLKTVTEGATVMFGRHAGTPLGHEYGDRLLLLKYEEIRMVVVE